MTLSAQNVRYSQTTSEEDLENSPQLSLPKVANISKQSIELAYLLIEDAAAGRVTYFNRNTKNIKFYKIYLSKIFSLIRLICHILLVILLFYDVTNSDRFSKTSIITVSLECYCLLFYGLQLVIVCQFSTPIIYFKDLKHYISAITILISLLDIILFMSGAYTFRISPCIRVLLFINSTEQSQIRRHFRTLRVTIIKALTISPFLLTFYLMMVAFIYKFFTTDRKPIFYYNDKPYMHNIQDIVWDTLVYITSANSPDVMLPAFADKTVVGFLFLIFYAVFFFLLIFIYGLIMGNFRSNARKEMHRLMTGKLSLVYDAFTLLSQQTNEIAETIEFDSSVKAAQLVITRKTWNLLMEHFKGYKNNQSASDVVFYLLCGQNKQFLTKSEFIKIGDLLSAPLSKVKDNLHFFEKKLWFNFSNKLSDFVESKIFNFLIAVFIVMNLLLITFLQFPYIELLFCLLFILELFLRLYVKGLARFFRSLWNIFDFVIIFVAFIFWFVEFANKDVNDINRQTITFALLILRNLRLIKLLRGVASYHQLLHTVGMLLPTIASLLLIIFCFIVVYVSIGTWLFRGLMYEEHNLAAYNIALSNCNNSLLSNTDFGRLHYCILSFNTFIAGFVTLSSVAVGNNWHVIAEGFVLASGQKIVTRIYFALFKGSMTYLLLLIMAFVLDVFLLAYDQKSGLKIEGDIIDRLNQLDINFKSYKDMRDTRKIEGWKDVDLAWYHIQRIHLIASDKTMFRLKVKGTRSVDYISQAMFQSEIEEEMKSDPKYRDLFTD